MSQLNRKLKIMVVEDSKDDILFLNESLKDISDSFVYCNYGHEALRMFSIGEYDAVLVNLTLPDMDGCDLISKLRQVCADVPIVVVTGADDPKLKVKAVAAGASGFYQKPYTREDHQMLMYQLDLGGSAFARGVTETREKQNAMKNWKTSMCGLIGVFCAGLSLIPEMPTLAAKVFVLLSTTLPNVGLMFARDGKVSDEQAGAGVKK